VQPAIMPRSRCSTANAPAVRSLVSAALRASVQAQGTSLQKSGCPYGTAYVKYPAPLQRHTSSSLALVGGELLAGCGFGGGEALGADVATGVVCGRARGIHQTSPCPRSHRS